MRNFGTILIATLLLCSGCYDTHRTPQTEPDAMLANTKIGALRPLCYGGCYNITDSIICVGSVTSSDSEGNFYRSVFIEDNTGAIEVKLGIYNISSLYPIGSKVALHLKGCAIMLDNNILQVGLPPYSYSTYLREFEAQQIIDQHIILSNSIEYVTPRLLSIAQLDTSLCGQFVRLENLYHSQLYDNKEGYYRFIDNENREIFIYISPYANLFLQQMPDAIVAIQGILYHESVGGESGRQFVIKPRFADDISDIGDNM